RKTEASRKQESQQEERESKQEITASGTNDKQESTSKLSQVSKKVVQSASKRRQARVVKQESASKSRQARIDKQESISKNEIKAEKIASMGDTLGMLTIREQDKEEQKAREERMIVMIVARM
ncbi:hypothetical protein Tco_0744653, partial [Tanacetum coccineum]